MSFCPSKDIHSVYLDGELPEVYKTEYESHLKICPTCQKELDKIKALRGIFQADSNSISLNDTYLNQSFDRLMVKMNYSKNTHRPENKNLSRLKILLPCAAAAAIGALVPLRMTFTKFNTVQSSTNPAVATAFSQIPSATNVSVGGGKGIVISGNIHESVLPSSIARAGNALIQNVSSTQNQNLDDGFMEKKFIRDVDVFRPAFNEDKTISIKITVPGIGPIITEFQFPNTVTTGHFE